MKTMLVAFVATIAITVGADTVLDQMGFSAEDRLSGDAVRLGNGDE